MDGSVVQYLKDFVAGALLCRGGVGLTILRCHSAACSHAVSPRESGFLSSEPLTCPKLGPATVSGHDGVGEGTPARVIRVVT